MTAKEFLYDWGGANVWHFQAINLHPSGRSVSVIDTETNQKLRDIAVGESPWGVVIR